MTSENTISRRGLFMKLGILFNGLVATALTVPIVRFLLSSVMRGRASAYLSWVPLGRVNEFPEGETRLATFRNPHVMPTDGKTVDTACWVRRVEGEQFQVFAINCAHLGCHLACTQPPDLIHGGALLLLWSTAGACRLRRYSTSTNAALLHGMTGDAVDQRGGLFAA